MHPSGTQAVVDLDAADKDSNPAKQASRAARVWLQIDMACVVEVKPKRMEDPSNQLPSASFKLNRMILILAGEKVSPDCGTYAVERREMLYDAVLRP